MTCIVALLAQVAVSVLIYECGSRKCARMDEDRWQAELAAPGWAGKYEFRTVASGVVCLVRK